VGFGGIGFVFVSVLLLTVLVLLRLSEGGFVSWRLDFFFVFYLDAFLSLACFLST